jgi:transposase
VIIDISGVTGMAILNAILGGERDPYKLAALADPHVRTSKKEIAKSLEGNWRPELLSVLCQQMQTISSIRSASRNAMKRWRRI